jgi:hypothetical protein
MSIARANVIMRDFRLPPRRSWGLRSSEMLRSLCFGSCLRKFWDRLSVPFSRVKGLHDSLKWDKQAARNVSKLST